MTRSRKILITVAAVVVFFFVVLPAAAYALRGTCMPRMDHRLVFENQMSTDVTIVNQDLNDKGEQFYEETLGTVPAGQTENLTLLIPNPKGRTVDSIKRTRAATVQLKAEDTAGSVIWQQSWSLGEFYDLKKEGWRVVISPETDSQ
jgi:hypothetical protein